MSYESLRVAIATKIVTEWPSTYPMVAEGQAFPGGTQPSGPWARFSIRPAANVITTVNAASNQIVGLVWLQIFLPEETGTRAAFVMADILAGIFEQKRGNTSTGSLLRFDQVELAPAGGSDGWAMWRATVRFREDSNLYT